MATTTQEDTTLSPLITLDMATALATLATPHITPDTTQSPLPFFQPVATILDMLTILMLLMLDSLTKDH